MAKASPEENKKGHALVSYFVSMYKHKYGRQPNINRYRDRWGFMDMLEDLGERDARRVIDYYLETKTPLHPVTFLFRNYDKLYSAMVEYEEWAARRRELRENTRKRVEGGND